MILSVSMCGSLNASSDFSGSEIPFSLSVMNQRATEGVHRPLPTIDLNGVLTHLLVPYYPRDSPTHLQKLPVSTTNPPTWIWYLISKLMSFLYPNCVSIISNPSVLIQSNAKVTITANLLIYSLTQSYTWFTTLHCYVDC